ncbi:MAG: hypothetical protein ACRDLD_06450 [Thermoleophilaceae bacterium]
MNRRHVHVAALIALLAAGTLAFTAAAGGADDDRDRRDRGARGSLALRLTPAYHGTADFLDVSAAKTAGYAELRDADGIACIDHLRKGAMGVHYVNGALVGDAFLFPARPEALVYEPTGDGKLELVALEYIVFQKAWDETHRKPPKLFGRRFHLIEKPNRYGLDPFYELHAWLWKPNPSGRFADYNPRVACQYKFTRP